MKSRIRVVGMDTPLEPERVKKAEDPARCKSGAAITNSSGFQEYNGYAPVDSEWFFEIRS